MCSAPGSAPWSYSSGSRTSSTSAPASMRSAAPAVSTSVISALAAPSRSRNVAMPKTLSPWSGIPGRRVRDPVSRPGRRAGRRSPIGPLRTASARRSMSVGPPLTMTTRAPLALARGHAVGGRVDAERRADGEQQVALLADPHRPVDDLGHERLAERDRVALEDPAAHLARRVLLAGAHPVEDLVHRPAVLAVPAARPPDRAVDLDDQLDGGARPSGGGRRRSG